MPTITAGAATSVGLVRAVNEDSHLLGIGTFAVADGMGGHRAGDRASQVAIEYLGTIDALRDMRAVTTDDLMGAIEGANTAIVIEANADPERAGMGTTVVGLALVDLADTPHWLAFNVGDSRLYRWDGAELHQITTDHSEVQELVSAGSITPAEARIHPQRNVITRSLGTTPPPRVDSWLMPFSPGAVFLLCSDGLSTEVPDVAIGRILLTSSSPQAAAERLVAAAESAGGRDNVTAIVVSVHGVPVGPTPITSAALPKQVEDPACE